jgi:DNA-directed RNA polymerase sigma subunit (sigma70/sigma32)
MTNPLIDNSERDKIILSRCAEIPKRSNESIGAEFGISRERVRQIQNTEEWRKRRQVGNAEAAARFREVFEKYEKIRPTAACRAS